MPKPIATDSDGLPQGLSERARMALLGGKVVDAAVIDLAADDPGAVAVLMMKQGASSTSSPEEMRVFMRKWARLQRVAYEIFDSEDEAEGT